MTNSMVKVDFSLPVHVSTKMLTRKCHVGDFTAGGYDVIISSDILTKLSLDLKK